MVDVGVDERDERRPDEAKAGVAGAGGADVGREPVDADAVAVGDLGDQVRAFGGVVDHDDGQWDEGGEAAGELFGAVVDGYDDGEVGQRDLDLVEDGVGEVAVEEAAREAGGGRVLDGQPAAVEQAAGAVAEADRADGRAADEQPSAIGVHDVVAQPDPEALRQHGHGANPPSAWTTEPLRTAASRLQQKATVAATSSGSRMRRRSWLSAKASTSSRS